MLNTLWSTDGIPLSTEDLPQTFPRPGLKALSTTRPFPFVCHQLHHVKKSIICVNFPLVKYLKNISLFLFLLFTESMCHLQTIFDDTLLVSGWGCSLPRQFRQSHERHVLFVARRKRDQPPRHWGTVLRYLQNERWTIHGLWGYWTCFLSEFGPRWIASLTFSKFYIYSWLFLRKSS